MSVIDFGDTLYNGSRMGCGGFSRIGKMYGL